MKEIMKLSLYITCLGVLLFPGCKDHLNPVNTSQNLPPGPFSVIVNTEGTNAVLRWTPATDPDRESVTYSVFLDEEEVQSGLSDTTAILERLEYETEFSGKVIASDNRGGSSEAGFNFTTEEIQIEWKISLGGSGDDIASSVHQTTDGGYIIAGHSNSSDGDVRGNHGGRDFWVVKLDGSGNLVWQQNYGGSQNDIASSIRQTMDGGLIIMGYSVSTDGDVVGNNGSSDYWIIKLNATGDIIWDKNFGGSEADSGRDIQETMDEGYIAGGTSVSEDGDVGANYGSNDYWILKLDRLRNVEWKQNYGGSSSDVLLSVKQTSDGGYLAVGHSSSSDGDAGGNNGSSDYWILKLDGGGHIEWERNLGGSNIDYAYSFQQAGDGYVIAGDTRSSDGDVTGFNGSLDFWIIKLDAAGNLEWEKSLGGSQSEEFRSVDKTTDKGFIVAGSSYSDDGDAEDNNGSADFWIVKLDGSGTIEWEKNFGGSMYEIVNSIRQTTDGGYIAAGFSNSSDGDVGGNNGRADLWIVKLK